MDQQIDAFLRALGEVSPHTRRTYKNDLNHFCRWYASRHEQSATIAALVPMTVVLYKAALVDRLQLKPATVRRRLATLHRFSQWAAAEGLITKIPTRDVKIPVVPRNKPRTLEPAAIERVLLEAQRDRHTLAVRNYAILRLLADTGIKVGVLVGLKRANITGPQDQEPAFLKTDNEQLIPLPYQTWAALEAYLAERPEIVDEHLFLSTRGTGLNTETVRHMINKYARRAGLDPKAVSPRMIRLLSPEPF